MNHLTEEELVERYYGAADNAADAHLQECAQCAAALAVLEIDLSALRPVQVPERDENYAEQMWARVEAALPGRALSGARLRRFRLWRGLGRGLAYAAGCATLLAGGFFVGRVWEHRHPAQAMTRGTQSPVIAPQPKVVVVVLGDHLDRSERLLVELKHANADSDTVDLAPLPAEARSLLAANRVFRDEAEDEGDPGLTKALDNLDRLLTEIADRPGGLDAAEASRIRDEMNAEGLLFEVRVLRSKNPHRMKSVRVVAKGGAA
jgi:hypothetical protein